MEQDSTVWWESAEKWIRSGADVPVRMQYDIQINMEDMDYGLRLDTDDTVSFALENGDNSTFKVVPITVEKVSAGITLSWYLVLARRSTSIRQKPQEDCM